jgi:hypothetical protein
MAISHAKCPKCETTSKLRPRDFSDQAIATLVTHGDLDRKMVGASICDECYDDLRDALIDHQRASALQPAAAANQKQATNAKSKRVS